MKLYPLDPNSRTAKNMLGLSKKLNIRDTIVQTAHAITRVVILADGSSEDHVLVLLAHHEEGKDMPESIAGVIKPEKTGLSALEYVQMLTQKTKAKKLLFYDRSRGRGGWVLFGKAESRLRGMFNIELVLEERGLRKYVCKRSGASHYVIIVVLNGLEDVKLDKHSIEDHLIRAAERLGIVGSKKHGKHQRSLEGIKRGCA